jgi:hypothetical protein
VHENSVDTGRRGSIDLFNKLIKKLPHVGIYVTAKKLERAV